MNYGGNEGKVICCPSVVCSRVWRGEKRAGLGGEIVISRAARCAVVDSPVLPSVGTWGEMGSCE